jgi:hypothetical protein
MRTRWFVLAVGTVLLAFPSAHAGGIGVLGDSYSDEYQFYSPHRSTARNWVEILAATRGVDFGEFRTEGRGEPRNQGFAYNWARSGATSADMIASGQHTGLAAQVARGEVSSAVLFVGGNDFIFALQSGDPRSALGGLGRKAAGNVRTAMETLLAASPHVKLLIATVPDVLDLPEFRDPMRAGTLDPAVTEIAIAELNAFNAEIRRMASGNVRVAVFDFARITLATRLLWPKTIVVSGRQIDRYRSGDTLDCLFLGDVRHLGTISQGMLAKMMIDALNRGCDAGIRPLHEREVVAFAESLARPAAASIPLTPASATRTSFAGE